MLTCSLQPYMDTSTIFLLYMLNYFISLGVKDSTSIDVGFLRIFPNFPKAVR